MAIIELLTVVLLALIFFEDLKYRGVSWYYFVILLSLIFWRFTESKGEWTFVLVNASFILTQMVLITLYYFFRRGTFQVINQCIGLGDLIFWGVMVFAFSPLNFVLFFIASSVFSLGCFFLFIRGKNRTIPLAGFQSLFLLLMITARLFGIEWGNFDDNKLIELFYGT